MTGNTLRELSRRYATGDIDRDTYRARRRALIADIVAGNVELVPYHPPEPDSPTVFPDDEDDGDTTQEIAAPLALPPHAGSRRSIGAYVLMGAVILITGLVAWWLARPGAAPTADLAAPAPRETPAEAVLFENFLAAQSWSAENLDQFAAAWAGLSPAARAGLRDTDAMRRLAEAILGQIATENALIELGDTATALEAQRNLLDFAARLGITDRRLDRAQQEWTETRRRYAADTETAEQVDTSAAGRRPPPE